MPHREPGQTSLLVIQPTPFCNINCSYCYLPTRNDRRTLTIENLQRIFEKVRTFPTVAETLDVVWHAGEPLVPGPQYYDAAFAQIRDACSGLDVRHAVQTNGMLINDAWCDLFEKWHVSVGVSVDGPQHIHDAHRKTRAGRGTHDKTMAGIRCLQRRNVAFYVISVLTKSALMAPDAMFAFYQENGIQDLGFNIDEQEGPYKNSSLGAEPDDQLIVRFFARFGQLMRERDYPIAVRELEQTLMGIRFMQRAAPNEQTLPFGIITIDVAGNVYTFSPELAGTSSETYPSFAIGNIFQHDFADLQASDVLRRMTAEITQGVEACQRECPYFALCGGGAPSNKLFENGSFASTETAYCRLTKKRVTDFLLDTIETRSAA